MQVFRNDLSFVTGVSQMPFNDSLPTIVYAYKAKKPVEGLGVVEEQMLLAHRYRNKLTEIEIQRRARVQEAICQLSPEYESLKAEREQLAAGIKEMRDEIRAIRKRTRKRSAVPEELSQKLTAAKARHKEVWSLLKPARAMAYKSDEAKLALALVDETANEELRIARKASGLYWCTYGMIERAARQAGKSIVPRFRRWYGSDKNNLLSVEGTVATQIKYGILAEEVFRGTNKQVRIEMEDTRKPFAGRKTAWATLWIRVASEKKKPIWAKVPFALSSKNRPLPNDALITGVMLQRRIVGCQQHWSVLFSLAKDGGWVKDDVAHSGSVGIDVGWRLLEDRLRVARWYGSDGDEGEVSIPIIHAQHWQQPDELKSIRDLEFNAARDALAAFLVSPATTPDWLLERTEAIRLWRSPARLAAVIASWRDARFAGDTEMFDRLSAWRKKEQHLCNWETHLRAQLVRWRLNLYRAVAAELSQRYRVAFIEDVNWKSMAKRPKPEQEGDAGTNRFWMRAASPGKFLQCVRYRFAETVKVSAKNTTQSCNKCGKLVGFDARFQVCAVCPHCGARWDQDANAARNLLAAGLKSDA
jgi:hypothetical protein